MAWIGRRRPDKGESWLKMINVISLGAGVQSTVMALMAARGEIEPMPDCAIFADTGWEPVSIYDHLDWLESVLPFYVYRVSAGDIKEDHLDGLNMTGQRFASMPLFTSNGGMGQRQCTHEYKIQPIEQKLRRMIGLEKGQHGPKEVAIIQWIGISTDEASRMKSSKKKYIKNIWPLIDMGVSRFNCEDWFKLNYPSRKLQKSACIGCPYTDDVRWRDMKNNDPVSFKEAVEFDKAIRHKGAKLRLMKEQQYLHRSLKPLDEVDFRSLEDMGQINMFENECEGMCGL